MQDLFFYSAKIIWLFISPAHLFLLLLLFSLLLLLYNKRRSGLFLLTILSLCAVFLTFFSPGDWLLHRLETQFTHNPSLPQKIDGIIVLGGAVLPQRSIEWQQLETNHAHERLSAFIALARQYPKARLVFTGGNGSLQADQPSEASQVLDYFLQSGIQRQRILMEGKSRNTFENARNLKNLVNPSPSENWILITTAFHMPRAAGVFCHQGWSVIPYPVDHYTTPSTMYNLKFNLSGNLGKLDLATHEWLGLLAYSLTDKTPQLIPVGCQY